MTEMPVHKYPFTQAIVCAFLLLSFFSCGTTKKKPVRLQTIHEQTNPSRIGVEQEERLTAFQTEGKAYLPRKEMRGVWLTTIYGLDWPKTPANTPQNQEKQKQELISLIDRLYRENYNTIFLQVRLRGDVIYRSQYEPLARVMTGGKYSYATEEYDPLQVAIEACHNRGMACHAWVVTFPLGSDKQVRSLGRNGIWYKHREWCIKHQNEWYLDPGNPAVREYIATLARELTSSYNVDGIHLDYIRYPENGERFNDSATYQKYGKNYSSKEQWRRDNISQLLRIVHKEANEAWPYIQISAATLGKYRTLPEYPGIGWTCYESVYQDPKAWFEEETIDFIVPMMYYKNEHFDPFLEDWHRTFSHLGPVIPGLGVYRLYDNAGWSSQDIEKQLQQIRMRNMSGICFYREENVRPSSSPTNINRTISNYFAFPAANIPLREAKGQYPTPKAPYLLQIKEEKERNCLIIEWESPATQTEEVTYNLYVRPYNKQSPQSFKLLATGISSCRCVVHKDVLPQDQLVEFCIEGANRLNICGPLSLPQVYFIGRDASH